MLAAHRPAAREAGARAAVAVVLRDGAGGGVEVLLIERAHKAGDPWSGHMAFPGGRQDPTDLSARHTAERETLRGGRPRSRHRGAARPARRPRGPPLGPARRPRDLRVRLLRRRSRAARSSSPRRSRPRSGCRSRGSSTAPRHVDYHFRHELVSLDMPGIRVGEPERARRVGPHLPLPRGLPRDPRHAAREPLEPAGERGVGLGPAPCGRASGLRRASARRRSRGGPPRDSSASRSARDVEVVRAPRPAAPSRSAGDPPGPGRLRVESSTMFTLCSASTRQMPATMPARSSPAASTR